MDSPAVNARAFRSNFRRRLIPSIALRRRLEEVAIMDLLSMLTATGEHLVGHPAPELGLTDLEGVEISLATLRGTPAVLNFWFLG